jgi:exopolysaccharide biosynthesis polyprenyl glycosylphosphotransferase
MSSTTERGVVVPRVAAAARPLRPLFELRASRELSSRRAARIAAVGRAGVVWLPVYAFLTSQIVSFAETLAVSVLLTAIWLVAIRSALATARPTLLALGPIVASALGCATGMVVVSAVNLWLPQLEIQSLSILKMAGSIFILSMAWERIVQRSAAVRKRVLILGTEGGGSALVEELASQEESPFEVVGIVDDGKSGQIAGAPILGRIADLPQIVGEVRPDLVVLAVNRNRPEAFKGLLSAAEAGFTVVGLPEFYEHAFGRVPVRHVTSAWFMSVLHLYQRPYNRVSKRLFDIGIASVGLVLAAPLFPILALLVRTTPGPVIFRQGRPGERGRTFTMYKFRTMRTDVELPGGATLAEEDDPRITRVGRMMRKRRLDELPQLWNVLKGDMSIVGPRPEPEFVVSESEAVPFWTRRRLVKPGLTGWAQIRRGYTGADSEGTMDKLSHDLWYLRHRSLVVDLAICAKTFSTLISGVGSR